MARLLHKPHIIQQTNGSKKSANHHIRRKLQDNPYLYSTTPIIVTMPNKENEVEGDVPGRKRISLACQRCRKRKIKCEPSGDAGDGQACVACQSANSPNCQYLRVNSGEVHCPSPESSSGPWQFSLPMNDDTSFNVVPAHDLSQYSINNLSQMALSTGRTPYRSPTNPDMFGRTSSLSLAVSPQRHVQTVSQHNLLGSELYSAHQAHDGLPYNHNTVSPAAFAMQDIPSAWASPPACGPASMDNTLAQNTSMDYSTLQYQDSSYPGADALSMRAEEAPYFPGLSPLTTHLPTPVGGNGRARCLPVPVQTYLSNKSSFSTANSQFTPETGMLSDHNSSSAASSSSSPPTTGEASMYEYTSSLAQTALGEANPAGYSAMSLPNINDPTDSQRLPTLDPPFQECHYPAGGVGTIGLTDPSRALEVTPRDYRLLQPQPRRASRSFLNSTEAGNSNTRRSAAARRQERQNAPRHQ